MRYSGIQLSALAQVEPYEIGRPCSGGDRRKPAYIDPSAAVATTKPRARKHRPKGSASGWLETRTGNKKRKNPSVSHYYRWDSPKGRITEYVKASKLPTVNRMLAENCTALDILSFVVEGKKKLSKQVESLLVNKNSESPQINS